MVSCVSRGRHAEDVAHLPASGIAPVIAATRTSQTSDLRLSERHLVIDLNDFDEAHPGAWDGTCDDWSRASGSQEDKTAPAKDSAAMQSLERCGLPQGIVLSRQRAVAVACLRASRRPSLHKTAANIRCAMRSRSLSGGAVAHERPRAATLHEEAERQALYLNERRDHRAPKAEADGMAAALDEYLNTLSRSGAECWAGYT